MKINFNSKWWNRILFLALGIGSLLWFLIRVIPKPSRAFYPCQRVAFPIATGFIIWLTVTMGGIFSIKNAKSSLYHSKLGLALIFILLAVLSFSMAALLVPNQIAQANENTTEPVPSVKNFVNEDASWIAPLTTVAVVKSEKENSDDISIDEIETMVRDAVSKAGGFEELISEGQTIVIKPNLVGRLEYSSGNWSGRVFPEFNNGIVTNWRIIKAIVKMVREQNSTGKVYVLEGSADGGTTKQIMDYFGYSHENIPGVTEFITLETRSGGYEEWDSDSLQAVTLPAGKALYANSLKPNNSDEFYLNKIYYSADVLISVPILKNHSMTSVTGAVKNVGIGATPANIYAGRTDIHRYFENRIDHSNYTNLHRFIHDWYLCKPVDYVIMDGLQGTDYGPVAAHPSGLASAKKNMGLILAGSDAVAVDAIASLLMGYDPSRVNHLVYLHNDTAGTIDPRTIRVESPIFQTLKKDFRHNESTGPKYSDFSAPEISLINFSIENEMLSFAIEPADEVIKVEVIVNGEKLPFDCISNFDSVSFNIGDFNMTTDAAFIINVFDRYLNCTQFSSDQLTSSHHVSAQKNIDFNIFPNPANDHLNILLPDQRQGKVGLKVYNVAGNLCAQTVLNKSYNEDLTLNVNQLENGNYFLEIQTTEKRMIGRFCKK